jgi:hypothetical protein
MATVLEQLACERKSENMYWATILAPPRAMFGISNYGLGMLLYAWALIILLYLVLYFLVPLCILNSVNGFRSGSAVLISSLILFALIVMVYVIWNRKKACQSKEEKLQYYVKGVRPSSPKYLQSAIERVQAFPQNIGRQPTRWNSVDIEE